jgi:uncharacterized protein YggE
VQGNGETRVRPNVATLYASLSQEGKTASEALDKINTQLNQITSVLQLNGVGQNDISTSSISVYPRYDYTNGTSTVIGYIVYVSLTITIRGIGGNSEKIARVIDGLASAGVSSIYGLSYDTSDPNAGKVDARRNAWNDAVAKARQYAQLAGRKLGKVLIIEEVSAAYYPFIYRTGLANPSTPFSIYQNSPGNPASVGNNVPVAAGATPELPTGTILITVIVIVVWELL